MQCCCSIADVNAKDATVDLQKAPPMPMPAFSGEEADDTVMRLSNQQELKRLDLDPAICPMASEDVWKELQHEQSMRQELEAALQQAAEYGQELLAQEQEQALQEYREKVQSLEASKSQVLTSRRTSQSRQGPRAKESWDYSCVRTRQTCLSRNARKEDDGSGGFDAAQPVVGRGGTIRPKRRSRKSCKFTHGEEAEEDSVETENEVQIRQLKQELEATRSEYSKRLKALEAELDTKKQEAQGHIEAEEEAKAESAETEAKLKDLQKRWEELMEENEKMEKELHLAGAKEQELAFQLEEEQALRNQARSSRRAWMPTACEEALRNAAATASLADEFDGIEEHDEEDESEEFGESDHTGYLRKGLESRDHISHMVR
eukprot:g21510.t1